MLLAEHENGGDDKRPAAGPDDIDRVRPSVKEPLGREVSGRARGDLRYL
jgi:hypothetical protein